MERPLYQRTKFAHFPYPYLPPAADLFPEPKSNLERSDQLDRAADVVMAKLDAMAGAAREGEGDRPIFRQMAAELADTVRGIVDDDVLVALLLKLYRH